MELVVSEPRWRLGSRVNYGLNIAESLVEAQEWDKLECWIGIVWMSLPGVEGRTGEDLENSMVLLFCQRPGAAQKLERWIERWSRRREEDVPESFECTLKRAHEAAQRQLVS